MRRFSSSLNKQIQNGFVRPVYLVEFEYENGQSYRFHSGDGGYSNVATVTGIGYGNDWVGNDIRISGAGWDIGQKGIPTVTFQNFDINMSSIMLNNLLADRPIKIWVLYLFDRYNFTVASTAASGQSTINVNEIIPIEVPTSGNLDLTGSGTYNKAYNARSGKIFTTTTTLASGLSVGTQIYVNGPGFSGVYTQNDVIPIFNGVINEIELDEKRVLITMLPQSAKTQYVPNRYIAKYSGFNWLPQTGAQVAWGNEIFILQKASN